MILRAVRKTAAIAMLLSFVVSCASSVELSRAKRHMKEGDLVGAVLYAAEAVAKDARNQDAVELLVSAYPVAVAGRSADADEAERGGEAHGLEEVVSALSDLHSMFDAVGALPRVYREKTSSEISFPVAYQYDRLSAARQEAAAALYAEAVALSGQGGRLSWREAHKLLVRALKYVPGFRDASSLAQSAYELGSDRVLVMPFLATGEGKVGHDVASYLYGAYLAGLVAGTESREYVQVLDRPLADTPGSENLAGAHILVVGQLTGVNLEEPYLEQRVVEVQAVVDEVIKGSVPVDGVYPTQRVTVEAEVTIHTLTSFASATLSIQAVDAETGLVLDTRTESTTIRQSVEWATFIGDRRALPPACRGLVERRERVIRWPEEVLKEMVRRLVNPALASLLAKLPVR